MADQTLNDDHDGVLSDTSNYSGGALPGNGDDLLILEGENPVTADLDALDAVDLAKLMVGDEFTANIGAANERMSVDATKLVWFGRGAAYFSGQFGDVIAEGVGSQSVLNVVSRNNTTAPIGNFRQRSGSAVITAGSKVDANKEIEVAGGNLVIEDAVVLTSTVAIARGKGVIECEELLVAGKAQEGGTIKLTSADGATLVEAEGGVIDIQCGGVIATLRNRTTDRRGVVFGNGKLPVTVTNYYRHAGATDDLADPEVAARVTITNLHVVPNPA